MEDSVTLLRFFNGRMATLEVRAVLDAIQLRAECCFIRPGVVEIVISGRNDPVLMCVDPDAETRGRTYRLEFAGGDHLCSELCVSIYSLICSDGVVLTSFTASGPLYASRDTLFHLPDMFNNSKIIPVYVQSVASLRQQLGY